MLWYARVQCRPPTWRLIRSQDHTSTYPGQLHIDDMEWRWRGRKVIFLSKYRTHIMNGKRGLLIGLIMTIVWASICFLVGSWTAVVFCTSFHDTTWMLQSCIGCRLKSTSIMQPCGTVEGEANLPSSPRPAFRFSSSCYVYWVCATD